MIKKSLVDSELHENSFDCFITSMMKRRPTMSIFCRCVSSVLQEDPDAGGIVIRGSIVQGCPLPIATNCPFVDCPPCVDERGHDRRVAVPAGRMKRRPAIPVIGGVDVASARQQALHRAQVAFH